MEYRLGVSGGMILKIGPMSLIPSVFLFLLFTDALLVIYLIIIDISLQYFSISILNSYLEDKRQRVSGNSHYFLIRHETPHLPCVAADCRKIAQGNETSLARHNMTELCLKILSGADSRNIVRFFL